MNENLLNVIYRNIFHRSVSARLYCDAYLNGNKYQYYWILLSTNHPRLILRHFIFLSNVSFSYVNQLSHGWMFMNLDYLTSNCTEGNAVSLTTYEY